MTDDTNSEAQKGSTASILNREASRLSAASKGPKVKFDDATMHSSYANVCNISFTREEVLLLFGMSEAWQGGQEEVSIQLTQKIIMSPFAAKRMHVLLGAILQQYEQRFTSLAAAVPATATGLRLNPPTSPPTAASTAARTSVSAPRSGASGANGAPGSPRSQGAPA